MASGGGERRAILLARQTRKLRRFPRHHRSDRFALAKFAWRRKNTASNKSNAEKKGHAEKSKEKKGKAVSEKIEMTFVIDLAKLISPAT
jgi:hypothetical protein